MTKEQIIDKMSNKVQNCNFAKPVLGSGMNKSELTKEQCLGILINWNVAFESLNNDDLDSLYKVATKHWAYHLTRQGYIDRLYKFRLENAVC